MKDTWKGFALSAAVGLILGGGAAAALGERNLQIEVVRLENAIKEVKADEKATFSAVYELTMGQVRMQEQLKAINEKLDALAR